MVEHIWTDNDPVGLPQDKLQDIWDAAPTRSGLAIFRMDLPPENRDHVAAQMSMVGTILADGQVTMEEAAQLLALAYPDLAGHPQMARVLQASSEAVKALRDDGRVSLAEAVAIVLPLLAGVPSIADLVEAAKVQARRLLSLRKTAP